MRGRAYDASKRAFDVVASSTALILLTPVTLTTGALVALRLGRPVFFKQSRPGLHGEPFELLKFRTMANLDESRGLVTNKQRLSRFGSKLRSWSLDELPSLVNVVRGDMSLVGPRPLLVTYLPLYTAEQRRRHDVRPGITGLAQVNGRNALDWDSRFRLDTYYVDHRSWMMDFGIILKSVLKVILRDGITTSGHAAGAPFNGSPMQSSDNDG